MEVLDCVKFNANKRLARIVHVGKWVFLYQTLAYRKIIPEDASRYLVYTKKYICHSVFVSLTRRLILINILNEMLVVIQ